MRGGKGPVQSQLLPFSPMEGHYWIGSKIEREKKKSTSGKGIGYSGQKSNQGKKCRWSFANGFES